MGTIVILPQQSKAKKKEIDDDGVGHLFVFLVIWIFAFMYFSYVDTPHTEKND